MSLRNANLSNLAQTLARQVKAMKAFDRVMIYQFEADDLDLDDKKSHQLIAQIPPSELLLIEKMTALVNNFQLEAIATLTQG